MATSIEVNNLREQVVEKLRAEILSDRTRAGTIYSVPGVASDLGISTTPVREALLELTGRALSHLCEIAALKLKPHR